MDQSNRKLIEKNIEISKFSLGIASSPHVGMGDMRNLDIYSKPGVVMINNALENVSETTVTNLPKWFVRNPTLTSQIWAIDSANRVYKSTDSGSSWTYISGNGAGAGQGGVIYRDYLLVTRSDVIDVYGPLSGSPSWSLSWQTIDSDTQIHPMIVSDNDGTVYGGAGRYIFSIVEQAGQTFLPSNPATYTFDQHAGDFILPKNYRVSCLAELGENIMVGTVF